MSVDAQALAASLDRLGRHDGPMLLATSLKRVIDACVQLFSVDGSGLMLADEHSALQYVVATDGPGRHLEQAQLEAGEGPCIDTFVTAEITACTDVRSDPRWPRLHPHMAGDHVAAVLGVPVHLAGITVGSLDLYKSEPHEWDESEQTGLVRYSHVIEDFMESAVSAEQAGELATQLNYALEYRVPIERGIVI